MHSYPQYFAQRHPQDALDCAPLIVAGLRENPSNAVLHFDEHAVTRAESAQRIAQLQRWFAQPKLFVSEPVFDEVIDGIECGPTRRVQMPAFDAGDSGAMLSAPRIDPFDPLCVI